MAKKRVQMQRSLAPGDLRRLVMQKSAQIDTMQMQLNALVSQVTQLQAVNRQLRERNTYLELQQLKRVKV